ncbi:hypothetical protein Gpo141_00000349 [Globisporangium polare]
MPRQQSVPTLGARHFLWWNATFGAKYQAAREAPAADAAAKAPTTIPTGAAQEITSLYEAIRDNRRDAVDACVQRHPHVVFAKRTALYVASFFGRHEIVKYLVERGADKNLRCEGFRPVDVAGAGRNHAIDRMKVQFLLGEEARPRVIVCTDDPASLRTSQAAIAPPHSSSVRVQIHFSEPVADFISDDIVASPRCRIRSFAMLRRDFYIVDVTVNRSDATEISGSIFVEVPEGVARSARRSPSGDTSTQQLNARSNRFVLVLAETVPSDSFSATDW